MRIKSFLALFIFLTMILSCRIGVASYSKPVRKPVSNHHHTPYGVRDSFNHNFLVGGEIGYAVRRGVFSTTLTAPGLTLPVVGVVTHDEKIVNQGTQLGLLLGWQFRYNRWMMGLEGNVDFSHFEQNLPFLFPINSAGSTVNFINGTVLYERGNIYGLTARAGYFLTPFFMPYLRLGAQVSRDELNYQAFIGATGAPSPGRVNDFLSEEKDIYGVVTGIGAEFPTYIGPSTIRVEYNFTWTHGLEMSESNAIFSAVDKFRRPITHVGKVAWVWNF